MNISENYRSLREEVPDEVTIVVACKSRTAEEVREVIEAGSTDIGENYVQEAVEAYDSLGEDARRVRWHMIGHLQKNKINRAIHVFHVIQVVDSLETAVAIDKRLAAAMKPTRITAD